jgi:hypothetical protein
MTEDADEAELVGHGEPFERMMTGSLVIAESIRVELVDLKNANERRGGGGG